MPPSFSVLLGLEKEFLLVTAVGDVPDTSGNRVPVGSWHGEYSPDVFLRGYFWDGKRGL